MNSPGQTASSFTPFWPLAILALSLALFLGLQLTNSIQQLVVLRQMAEQQNIMAGQATIAENTLKALMMDLLTLSKNDPDARAIVGKYGIKFNPASAQVP